MKKFLLLIFAFVCIKSYAQTNGLTYQAVIFNPASQNAVEKPLANQKVCMQFKIVTNDFQVDYEEYIQTTTDQFGAVNLLIGSGTRVGGLVNSIDKINWGVGRKNLVVSINIYGNCVTYTEISNQPFTAVPFAMYAANGASASSSSKGVIQLAGDLAGTGSSADKPIISTDAITTNKIKNLAVTDEKIANGISASKVGLGNVNNTSDLDKPISTAVKAALDKKVNVADAESMMLPLAKQAETVASLNTKVNVADTAAMLNPYAKQAATNSAIALKVNIADTAAMLNPYAKAAATNSAIALKVNIADTAAMLNPYAKQAATQTALNAKANAADLDAKAPIASPTFTGTVSGITKSMVGLGNVDNTSDANKPVSTATQTALNAKANAADLDAKAPIASPTFTGTVSGITKSMVGLGNVDNTSDANKPVSTATQTALNAKAALASPTFTGVPVAPTAAASSNNTQIATTEYVDRQVTLSGGVMDKKVNEMNNLNVTGLKTIFMSNIDGISGSITNLIGGVKGQSINLVFTPSVFSDYMYVTFQTGGNIGVSYNRSIYSFYSGKIELIFDGTYWRVMTSDYW